MKTDTNRLAMGLEDFKTDDSSTVNKSDISFSRRETVQATLTGDVTDAQLSLDYYAD